MKGKLPWILAVLIAGALMAGCRGTLIVQVVDSPTSTPTPTPRAGSTTMPLLPSSATPGTTRVLPPTATPTSIPFPTSTAAPAPPPAPTEAPKPTEAAAAPTQAPTSLPTAKSGVVITTPTPAPASEVAPPGSPLEIAPGVALRVPRMWHTATRLIDGRVLLTGGSRAAPDFLADAELFDPTSGQTRQAASLHTPRHEHSATLLPDGRVLVVGGYSLPRQWLDDAEVYDPATDSWKVVPPRASHAVAHTATRMNDGRVLVVGGNPGSGADTNRVEIFDPRTDAWSEARPLELNRAGHTADLLEDGRVLVAGGACSGSVRCSDGDALLYDPQADAWAAIGPMVRPLAGSRSVRLPDGRVLVAGGAGSDPTNPPISASAEIYDPATNSWTAAADLAEARYFHELVLVSSGRVLAVGGARDWDSFWTGDSFVREIELYDPATNRWRIVGELPVARAGSAATLLTDGRVWVTGGRNDTTFFSDSYVIGRRPAATVPPPAQGDTLLMLHFDEPAGATPFHDSSPRGNDARCESGSCPTVAWQGLEYNGQSSYLASDASVQGLSSFTLGGWFYARSYEHAGKWPLVFWAPGPDCGRAALAIGGAFGGGSDYTLAPALFVTDKVTARFGR